MTTAELAEELAIKYEFFRITVDGESNFNPDFMAAINEAVAHARKSDLDDVLAAYDLAVLEHEQWDKKRIEELQEVRTRLMNDQRIIKALRDALVRIQFVYEPQCCCSGGICAKCQADTAIKLAEEATK